MGSREYYKDFPHKRPRFEQSADGRWTFKSYEEAVGVDDLMLNVAEHPELATATSAAAASIINCACDVFARCCC